MLMQAIPNCRISPQLQVKYPISIMRSKIAILSIIRDRFLGLHLSVSLAKNRTWPYSFPSPIQTPGHLTDTFVSQIYRESTSIFSGSAPRGRVSLCSSLILNRSRSRTSKADSISNTFRPVGLIGQLLICHCLNIALRSCGGCDLPYTT
jgi:hypothetical protein